MSLKKLIKQDAKIVMGVDSSPSSFAFCLYDGAPLKWGKIQFNGNNIYERVVDCRNKMQFIKNEFHPDYICIESAIMVKSQAVAINMAMIVGSLISELAVDTKSIITVPPATWQNYIGNKNLTKIEKDQIKKDYPGKSESWYRSTARNIRKQRTMDFFNNKFSMNLTDNDTADACGIAYYSYERLTSRG